jgi:hypothetical protein
VNHQIQHHVDVQAAGTEKTQAVNLKEQWKCDLTQQGLNGRIEALQVAHL